MSSLDASSNLGVEEKLSEVKDLPIEKAALSAEKAAVPTQDVSLDILDIQPAYSYLNGTEVYTVDSVAAYEEVPMCSSSDNDDVHGNEESEWEEEECVTSDQLAREAEDEISADSADEKGLINRKHRRRADAWLCNCRLLYQRLAYRRLKGICRPVYIKRGVFIRCKCRRVHNRRVLGH